MKTKSQSKPSYNFDSLGPNFKVYFSKYDLILESSKVVNLFLPNPVLMKNEFGISYGGLRNEKKLKITKYIKKL